MSNAFKTQLFTLVAAAFLAALIPGSSAQVRLEFTGSTEFPSLKCIMKPQQYDLDINNKTLCFCVWIREVIPTWNCIKADGKVTLDDLKMVLETIKNLTRMLPPTGEPRDPNIKPIDLPNQPTGLPNDPPQLPNNPVETPDTPNNEGKEGAGKQTSSLFQESNKRPMPTNIGEKVPKLSRQFLNI